MAHVHEICAPCHTASPPLIAYACFSGLLDGEADLQDVQDANDEVIPVEGDFGFHSSPLLLAAINTSTLREACDRTESVRLCEEVRVGDLARRENAAVRLAQTIPLTLPTLHPTSKWLGDVVQGAVPVNTSVRMLSDQAHRNGLHVVELFGGIGLGFLRTALAAGYTIRCYTYVDRDNISRRIARSVLHSLQQQYPLQLPASFTRAFDKRLPQSISAVSQLFLTNLVARSGPVDLLGGSWECKSVSRAGRQLGAMDPRFTFFYDLVRIINFFQRE